MRIPWVCEKCGRENWSYSACGCAASAATSSATPAHGEGEFVLVPKEPTFEMLQAGYVAWLQADKTQVYGEAIFDRAYQAALAAAPKSSGWRDISSAPKDGSMIIVPGGIAYWNASHEAWFTLAAEAWPGRRIQWKVTIWQPFPIHSVEGEK